MQYLGAISKTREWSLFLSKTNHSISSNQSLCPKHQCWRRWSWTVLWRPTRPSRAKTRKKEKGLFIIGDWKAKVGSQETPRVTSKFDLGAQNEAGQRLTDFCQENALVIENTFFQQHERKLHGYHQMVNTKIRLIILFAAKDGETLYSQQKEDWELTEAHIMST